MALVGRLEDLQLAELFHLLSLFRKSGELTLRSGNRSGVFNFTNGKIVHAADGQPRETLGDILVSRGLISDAELHRALEMQKRGEVWRRLGTILVELGAVDADIMERLIRERLQEITEHFLHWKTGFFSFKPVSDSDEPGAITGNGDVELREGMNTDQFILEILTKLDEVSRFDEPGRRDEGDSGATRALTAAEPEQDLHRLLDYMLDPSTRDEAGEAPRDSAAMSEELADLRSLMVEIQLRTPSFTGEITLMILRFATRVVNRGVLCHVGPDGVRGIGQFGIDACLPAGVSGDRRVRQMVVPCHEASVFFEVVENMHTYRGPLKQCQWNLHLAEQLGGIIPTEVVAVPIIVDGMIVGIFYGDNVPENRPIGQTHGLELLMIEAGLAMEKNLLKTKLRQVEEQVRMLSRSLPPRGGVDE